MNVTPSISILGGRLIDPANNIDEVTELHLADGKVLAIGDAPAGFEADDVIDASGQIVCPGLIDLGVKLREPGYEYKATIASETLAAARGGITTLICSPDTDPVIDTPAVWELIRHRAKACNQARVLAIGGITKGLNGSELSEMAALKAAGCVALSNAHAPLANTLVERRALEYAASFDMTVILRPEDKHLKAGGCAHEGAVATRLGLPGIPSAAENVAVARDLALAEHTSARVHFHCLSTKGAARMLGDAQAARLPVSADVAIHQLHLTEMDVDDFDSCCHVSPPLRTLGDRDALRQAVASGVISVICSDHQPHDPDAKEAPFPETAPGVSGLDTLLPLTLKLVDEGLLKMSQAVAALTSGPAAVLGLPLGQLAAGNTADLCIFDPEVIWSLTEDEMKSAGKNTPFLDWEFKGRVTHTFFEGRKVFSHTGGTS